MFMLNFALTNYIYCNEVPAYMDQYMEILYFDTQCVSHLLWLIIPYGGHNALLTSVWLCSDVYCAEVCEQST